MGDFGVTFSELATVTPCTVNDIYGCTDDGNSKSYQFYLPY